MAFCRVPKHLAHFRGEAKDDAERAVHGRLEAESESDTQVGHGEIYEPKDGAHKFSQYIAVKYVTTIIIILVERKAREPDHESDNLEQNENLMSNRQTACRI